jgi:hypothetical protein
MEKKKKITRARIFKLSIISSILLFLSLFYGQILWSELWLIYGFIQVGIIALFFLTVVWGLIFWMRNNEEYQAGFVPLLITLTFLCLVIFLPLNKIRNRLEFTTNKRQFEKAVNLVLATNKKTEYPTLYKLPKNYQFLSAGGGEVIIINKVTSKGVLFYTFRGTPDGISGFFKIKGDGRIDDFKNDLSGDITELRDLGDNWYFISGE